MSAEEVDYLSVEDLLEIAAGVMDQVVVRDAGLLASAAARPQVTVFGDDAYPSFEDKAAALLHSLVRNHALVDGNKRLAWSAARIFYLLNGRDLTYTDDEGKKWGVSPGKIHLGDLTLPMPFGFSAPPGSMEEIQGRLWEWDVINRGASSAAARRTWREADEAIRRRKEAARRPDTTRIRR